MNKYEVMYIVRADLAIEAIKNVVAETNAIFTSNASKVLECKEWGIRELAYEINHARKGYYVWLSVEATPVAVAEFDRIVGYNENIVRHIVVVDER